MIMEQNMVDHENKCDSSNFLGKIFFWWMKPFFFRNDLEDLKTIDLGPSYFPDASKLLGNELQKYWEEEMEQAQRKKKKPKLLNAIKKAYFRSIIPYTAMLFFVHVILKAIRPIIFGQLIRHFDSRSTSTPFDACLIALQLIGLEISISILRHNGMFGLLEIGNRCRIATCYLIYNKTLHLPSSDDATQGFILNLVTNDVGKFQRTFSYFHLFLTVPFQITVTCYMIWQKLGIATIAGMSFIIVQTVLIQGTVGILITKLRRIIAVRCDKRLRIMEEMIKGVRNIKIYAWEKSFGDMIARIRRYEVQALTWMSYIRAYNAACQECSDGVALFLTILAYVLQGHIVSADIVFPVAQYYLNTLFTVTILFPNTITLGAESLVSIHRIQKFLLFEEQQTSVVHQMNMERPNVDVEIANASATWDQNKIVTLHDINLSIERGKFIVLIGKTGAGKSSLIKLILDELPILKGEIRVNGKISYASQEPWLFPDTLKNNILFGEAYDKVKYDRVTSACALDKDFLQLSRGDKTFVGDRGASLSGGQRARVNLARTIYRDAEIYLLDDPLSAVDSLVGKHLFEECIKGFLSSKTIILVTHQLAYLEDVDNVFVLENGKINPTNSSSNKSQTYADCQASMKSLKPNDETKVGRNLSTIHNFDENSSTNGIGDDDEEEPKESEELVAKEAVSKMLVIKYFRAGASSLAIICFFSTIIVAQTITGSINFWLSYWTQEEATRTINLEELSISNITIGPAMSNNSFIVTNTNSETIFTKYMSGKSALWVFGFLVLALVISSVIKNVFFYKICMNASRKLHKSMFSSVLKAPMHFFDSNPAGRILNRFSKDMGAVDELVPEVLIETIKIVTMTISFVIQMLIINWKIPFFVLIFGLVARKMINIYLPTAKCFARLEASAKSPVLSHINSSLLGTTTIRSFHAEKLMIVDFNSRQDVHSKAYHLVIASSLAFTLWIDLALIIFISVVAFGFVLVDSSAIFAGEVGHALSQIFMLCNFFQWGTRNMIQTLIKMISVERIIQFTKLQQEDSFEQNPHEKPPKDWPSKGQLKFDNVSLRYSEFDAPALRNVNFSVDSGMKIGIVGRTGAGKSSLVSALFRLANVEGNIYLDGIDTSKIGLHDLRPKISIIPQEPMLFCASLRDNIDPFHEYDDALLWSALEVVELKNAVSGLDQKVAQGGNNFSAGQKQLLCLARAIVRGNKLLVLDEATANVDPKTDEIIQKTIKSKFKDCTVLTIAHRLNTIMDSDKIIVMDDGEVIEYDDPHILMQKKDGFFSKIGSNLNPIETRDSHWIKTPKNPR